MINPGLAPALRRNGYDALHCAEVGLSNQGVPDEVQLEYATGNGRAILTFNIVDFGPLDAQWKATGRRHAGIVVSTEIRAIGELLRRVTRHLDTYSPSQQDDLLLWLA